MNTKTIIVLFLFFAICLNACIEKREQVEEQVEVAIPKPVDFSVLYKSGFLNKNNSWFSIDSLNKVLYVRFGIKGLKDLAFPVDPKHKVTLFKTAFTFDFYCDNKMIASDFPVLHSPFQEKYIYGNDPSLNPKNLSFTTDNVDLRELNELVIEIPFYAFHNLKRGNHKIELAISQSLFKGDVYIANDDSSDSTFTMLYATKPLLKARLKFDFNVPAIYKSVIYGHGLQLKNDSTFSPARMENPTFWEGNSYPDIYWVVFFPTTTLYAKTPVETSTDKYVARDTFNLYHYYPTDSVGFGVYDDDNWSSDDELGYWKGSLNDLTKREYRRLTFDAVKHFDLKVEAGKIVN